MRRKSRPAESVKSVVLRMGGNYIAALDKLCTANQRSRREIIEILVHEAAAELKANPNARINP